MQTYTYFDYTLTLEATGTYDEPGRWGKPQVAYSLSKEGESEPIFSGRDLYAGAGSDPEGPESAGALLCFLTLREGDIEDDYFDNYTPRQIEFRDCEAEELSIWGIDLEEGREVECYT